METPAPIAPAAAPPARLVSLDAYRGFVMLLIVAEVLKLRRVASRVPESSLWQFLAHHQTHAPWLGCSLHDTIQPSFSFLVGAALPFSLAARQAAGQSRTAMTLHAFWRALLLVLLGIGLRSVGTPMTNWTFEDTLTQIGLGYGVLFLLGFQSVRVQWAALALVLVGYWAAFALHPLPPADFDYARVAVPDAERANLFTGFAAHWNKNSNFAWAFDTWFLNLFPRPAPFVANEGGYATLSFIPTLGTMLLGLFAGGVLRSARAPGAKVRWFAVAGAATLAAGLVLGATGVCPVVKRIWTSSWTLFSGGLCFFYLAGFYTVVDLWQRRAWALPLLVYGTNSILAYSVAKLWLGFFSDYLHTNLGMDFFRAFGPAYESFLVGLGAMAIFWLIHLWLYRRKFFVKI